MTITNADLGKQTIEAKRFFETFTARPASESKNPSKSELRISQLSDRCRSQAEELHRLLSSLSSTKSGKGLPHLLTTVKTMRSESQVQQMEEALLKSRDELHFLLTATLYSRGLNLSSGSNSNILPSREPSLENQDAFIEMRKAIDDLRDRILPNNAPSQLFDTLNNPFEATNATQSKQAALLSFLHDPGSKRRYKEVSRAHHGSFEWLFSEQHEGKALGFRDWLQGDSNLFWITGKPGSGNSTLMKYICEHSSTSHHLNIWGEGKPPIMATYFFWVSHCIYDISNKQSVLWVLITNELNTTKQ